MKTLLKWIDTHKIKLLAFFFWMTVVVSYWLYTNAQNLTPWEVVERIAHLFMDTAVGMLLFVIVFSVLPLLLFPSSLLAIAAGSLFGPVWGVLVTTAGAVGSSLATYSAGYFFGRDIETSDKQNLIGVYRQRLHDNTFETLLILHLVFLPFDLINYCSGFLRLRLRPFLLATIIGSIPGIFALVFFGASMEFAQLQGGLPKLDWNMMIASVLLLIISLAISRYIKRRTPAPVAN